MSTFWCVRSPHLKDQRATTSVPWEHRREEEEEDVCLSTRSVTEDTSLRVTSFDLFLLSSFRPSAAAPCQTGLRDRVSIACRIRNGGRGESKTQDICSKEVRVWA